MLDQFVNSDVKRKGRILILGEPGSGKTTALERFTLAVSRPWKKQLNWRNTMPVLVRLGSLDDKKLLDYVAKSMIESVRTRSGKVLAEGLEDLLIKGRVALLFDALDEVLGDRRKTVLNELKRIMESSVYSYAPMIVSARIRQDPHQKIGDERVISAYTLQELDDLAVRTFIDVYRRDGDLPETLWERLENHGLLEKGELGRNPFWLRLVLKHGVFVGSKGKILEDAIIRLLNREWSKEEQNRVWRRYDDLNSKSEIDSNIDWAIQLQETKLALAHLAYHMSMARVLEFSEQQALISVEQHLSKRVDIPPLRPRDVVELGRDAQLLIYDPGPVQFRHRLLQEYFTAYLLSNQIEHLPAFVDAWADTQDMWETFLLLADLLSDPSILIEEVLGDGNHAGRVILALGLLSRASVSNEALQAKVSNEALQAKVTHSLVTVFKQGMTDEAAALIDDMLKRGGTKAWEKFSLLLFIRDPVVVEACMQIYRKFGDSHAAEVLIVRLDPSKGDILTHALAQIGKHAVEPLIKTLKDQGNDSFVQASAAKALGQIEDSRAVEPLIEILQIQAIDSSVCKSVIEALGQIKDPRATEPLIKNLQDSDSSMRAIVVKALGQIGDTRAVQPLIEALEDNHLLVRRLAAQALGQIGDSRAVNPLTQKALRDSDPHVRASAVNALVQIEDTTVADAMINILQCSELYVRITVVKALGKARADWTVETLIRALKDDDQSVRSYAIDALTKKESSAIKPLIQTLQDSNPSVRASAKKALVQIGEVAIKPLIETLQDKDNDSFLRSSAAEALGEIKGPT